MENLDPNHQESGFEGQHLAEELEAIAPDPPVQTEMAPEVKWIQEGVIRTPRSIEKYERFFGPEVKESGEGLMLDLAAGDSNFAETLNEQGDKKLKVVRADALYGIDAPDYKRGSVNALAQELPFPDRTFDKVVNSFMLQHLRPADRPKAIREMIRVTKPDGDVMIAPSWHMARGYKSDYEFIHEKRLSKTGPRALIIHKEADISNLDWDRIAEDVGKNFKSGFGDNMHSFMRRIQKRGIQNTGTNRAPLNAFKQLASLFRKKR